LRGSANTFGPPAVFPEGYPSARWRKDLRPVRLSHAAVSIWRSDALCDPGSAKDGARWSDFRSAEHFGCRIVQPWRRARAGLRPAPTGAPVTLACAACGVKRAAWGTRTPSAPWLNTFGPPAPHLDPSSSQNNALVTVSFVGAGLSVCAVAQTPSARPSCIPVSRVSKAAHPRGRGWPHWVQKRSCGSLSAPHWAQ